MKQLPAKWILASQLVINQTEYAIKLWAIIPQQGSATDSCTTNTTFRGQEWRNKRNKKLTVLRITAQNLSYFCDSFICYVFGLPEVIKFPYILCVASDLVDK